MAVDEINARGGIAGRSIEILVKDDQGTPEGAVASDTELVNQGVVCIIGHATSAQTIGRNVIEEKGGQFNGAHDLLCGSCRESTMIISYGLFNR